LIIEKALDLLRRHGKLKTEELALGRTPHMNQPTWEEFQRLEQEQRRLEEENKEIRKRLEHIERHTEPIPATTRIEVASADVEHRLDNHTELLKEISQKQDKQEKQLGSISTDMDELKLDAKAFVGDSAIFKNKLEHMEIDVSTLKTDIGMLKTDIEQTKTMLNGHAKYFEEHGRRLSQIESSMATKSDISELRTDIDSIKSTQEQILKLLQQKG